MGLTTNQGRWDGAGLQWLQWTNGMVPESVLGVKRYVRGGGETAPHHFLRKDQENYSFFAINFTFKYKNSVSLSQTHLLREFSCCAIEIQVHVSHNSSERLSPLPSLDTTRVFTRRPCWQCACGCVQCSKHPTVCTRAWHDTQHTRYTAARGLKQFTLFPSRRYTVHRQQ